MKKMKIVLACFLLVVLGLACAGVWSAIRRDVRAAQAREKQDRIVHEVNKEMQEESAFLQLRDAVYGEHFLPPAYLKGSPAELCLLRQSWQSAQELVAAVELRELSPEGRTFLRIHNVNLAGAKERRSVASRAYLQAIRNLPEGNKVTCLINEFGKTTARIVDPNAAFEFPSR